MIPTTADFYDETGRRARWLGALHGNADPETLRCLDSGRHMLDATDLTTFAEAALDLLEAFSQQNLGHSHHPRDGWPWSWPDTFDRGRAWVITGRIWSYAMPRVDHPPPRPITHARPPRLSEPRPHCPDCEVAIGQPHVDGCDVARCLRTGLQRLSCERNHNCGKGTWSGRWPGETDCERLGWMIGPGLPDLNRL